MRSRRRPPRRPPRRPLGRPLLLVPAVLWLYGCGLFYPQVQVRWQDGVARIENRFLGEDAGFDRLRLQVGEEVVWSMGCGPGGSIGGVELSAGGIEPFAVDGRCCVVQPWPAGRRIEPPWDLVVWGANAFGKPSKKAYRLQPPPDPVADVDSD